MEGDGLNSREAAVLIGKISRQAVEKAADRGKILRLPNGRLDRESVAAYSPGRRAPRGGATKRPVAPVAAVDGEAAAKARAAFEATLGSGGIFTSRADAELARDTFAAHSRRLEFEERAGRLVETDKVNRSIASACGKVRSRLLSVPAEWAPAIFRCKTVAEVEDMLREAITAALEALAEDFGEGD